MRRGTAFACSRARVNGTSPLAEKDALEAKRAAQDRERRRQAGLPEPRAAITYRELTEIFLDQYQVGGRRTKKWMEEMLAYSQSAFGPVLVRHLMPDQIGR